MFPSVGCVCVCVCACEPVSVRVVVIDPNYTNSTCIYIVYIYIYMSINPSLQGEILLAFFLSVSILAYTYPRLHVLSKASVL